MSAPTTDRPTTDRPATGRDRARIAGLVAAALLVLLAGFALVTAGSDPGGAGTGAAGTAASTTPGAPPRDESVTAAPTMPEATGPTTATTALPAALPEVGLDEPAASDEGMRAEVVSVEAVQGTASGVGNVAGPALRVTLRLENGTPEPVTLDFVTAELAHGADRTPAPRVNDPSEAPFVGTLEPGAAAEGVYVFTVPEDDRAQISVAVGYRAGAPYLVFTGPAPAAG